MIWIALIPNFDAMADLQYPRADQAECAAVNERENLSRITMMNTRSLIYFHRRDPKKSAGLSLVSAKPYQFPTQRTQCFDSNRRQ